MMIPWSDSMKILHVSFTCYQSNRHELKCGTVGGRPKALGIMSLWIKLAVSSVGVLLPYHLPWILLKGFAPQTPHFFPYRCCFPWCSAIPCSPKYNDLTQIGHVCPCRNVLVAGQNPFLRDLARHVSATATCCDDLKTCSHRRPTCQISGGWFSNPFHLKSGYICNSSSMSYWLLALLPQNAYSILELR